MSEEFVLRMNRRALSVLSNAILNIDDLLDDDELSTLIGCRREEFSKLLRYIQVVRHAKNQQPNGLEIAD